MLKKTIMGLAVLLTPLSVSAADVTQDIMANDVNAIGKTSVKALKAKIDKGDKLVIIDVRTGASWEHSKVKIKGATRIPYQEIAKRAIEIPMGSEIVTYCTWGNEATSARAAVILKRLGFQKVTALLGGFDAWASAKYPLEPK